MKSIIQTEKKCFVCGTERGLHSHHVFYGSGKHKLAEDDGMKVWLCYEHHEGNSGVHHAGNRELDLYIRREAQKVWEQTYGTREDFMKRYTVNYL